MHLAATRISRSCQSKCPYGIEQILLGLEQLTRILFPKRFWEREALFFLMLFLTPLIQFRPSFPSSITPPGLPSPSLRSLPPRASPSVGGVEWEDPSRNSSAAHPQGPHAEL